MKRLGAGKYAIGHLEIWEEKKGKWRIWDTSTDPPCQLEAYPTLKEAAIHCKRELEIEPK